MPDKIKVLHIITRLDKGGSAENTFLTVTGLDRKSYDLTLFIGPVSDSAQDRKKQLEENKIKYFLIPELVRNVSPVKDIKTLLKLYRFLKKEKFDIVHTHTSKAGFLGRFAAKLAGIPIVIHTPHGHVFFGYFGSLKSKAFIFLEKLASLFTDRIVALTNRERDDYRKYKIAAEGKLVVIHSGIELDKFKEPSFNEKQNFKEELGIPENYLVVGTAGRLVPVKGLGFLVEAAKQITSQYHDTFFILAGDGELRESLEKKASELGLKDNIRFLGWRDDIARIIFVFDVFALPSLNEGMGRVLVEAMACGKPIVASSTGGIPDLVIHGKNGFLVPAKDSKELARYIQFLLEDKGRREKMGVAGKEMAANFSKEIMVDKIAELYQELITQKNMGF
jgi:glycosyltransferase involved in cell wall biosynthesis